MRIFFNKVDGADSKNVGQKNLQKIRNMLKLTLKKRSQRFLKVTLLWVSDLQNLAKRWRCTVGSVSYA